MRCAPLWLFFFKSRERLLAGKIVSQMRGAHLRLAFVKSREAAFYRRKLANFRANNKINGECRGAFGPFAEVWSGAPERGLG